MNLGFFPIASSSKGNSYLIKSESTAILLDAGITGVKIATALKNINMMLADVNGLLITHEHADHVKGASPVMSKNKECIMYCSKGTRDDLESKMSRFPKDRVVVVSSQEAFQVGDIEVLPFKVSHDANEPLGYTFSRNGKKISVVTDTGMLTEEIETTIADSDILVIESNHEENILLYGRYPYNIKRRILSNVGHISNETCGYGISRFLKDIDGKKIPLVYLAHLSQENNTPQQAVLTVNNILEENDFYVGRDLEMKVLSPMAGDEYIEI